MVTGDEWRRRKEGLADPSPAQAPPFTMPFGKHKGRILDDVPAGYLRFFLTLENLRPVVVDAIVTYLGKLGPGGGWTPPPPKAEPPPAPYSRKPGRPPAPPARDQAPLPLDGRAPWEDDEPAAPPPAPMLPDVDAYGWF